MQEKKRCCATVRTIKHLDPGLLSILLRKFPEVRLMQSPSLSATAAPTASDYDALQVAWLAGTMPQDLRNVFFYVTFLGSAAGWEHIQEEARARNLHFDFSTEGFTHADLAVKAWLSAGPKHRSILEGSYSRTRFKGRYTFVYYLPSQDIRANFTVPSDATMAVIRQELAAYFGVATCAPAIDVTRVDTPDEIRFLIRYQGQATCQESFDNKSKAHGLKYKPAEYDFVAYNIAHGNLRMTTNRGRDRAKYRLLFGKALLGNACAFAADEPAVSLEPLKGPCRQIFKCEDIAGLAEIDPIAVGFHRISCPGKEIVWQADNNTTLWEFSALQPALVPDDTDTVRHAVVRYRLTDSPTHASVAVSQGNTIEYEHESHAPIMDNWFCRRGIIRSVFNKATGLAILLARFLIELDDIIPDCADTLLDLVT